MRLHITCASPSSPEEANRLGCELAKRFTKENNAFKANIDVLLKKDQQKTATQEHRPHRYSFRFLSDFQSRSHRIYPVFSRTLSCSPGIGVEPQQAETLRFLPWAETGGWAFVVTDALLAPFL